MKWTRTICHESRAVVTQTVQSHLDPAQAEALACLVELEARWENTPQAGPRGAAGDSVETLQAKQRAFDSYHAKLVAYNKRYKPAHEGERPATTPPRLSAWCRKMRDLYLRVEHKADCPAQLMEKTFRTADRLAARLNREPVSRTTPLVDVRGAISDWGAVADWCDGLTVTAEGGFQSEPSPAD
jgi:hypothetical protein